MNTLSTTLATSQPAAPIQPAITRRELLLSTAAVGAAGVAGAAGLKIGKRLGQPPANPGAVAWDKQAWEIYDRHWLQTRETVAALKKKYEQAVFGKVRVWDMFEKLSLCVDPTDVTLYCANQHIHVLQMLDAMERDGITDPDFLVAAMLHDLGKVLLLTEEAPENIVCTNRPIGEFEPGCGLDSVIFQWNHDEFIYSRIKDHVPEQIAWMVRFHSDPPEFCSQYMNQRDRQFMEQYMRTFHHYDQNTKSICRLPKLDMRKYRGLLESYIPGEILV